MTDDSELEKLMQAILTQTQEDVETIRRLASVAVYLPAETPIRLMPFIIALMKCMGLDVRIFPHTAQTVWLQGCGNPQQERN